MSAEYDHPAEAIKGDVGRFIESVRSNGISLTEEACR